jgi:hypothetical protein
LVVGADPQHGLACDLSGAQSGDRAARLVPVDYGADGGAEAPARDEVGQRREVAADARLVARRVTA